MGKHTESINRKKVSELISLNSLLPCLHMSLEDSFLICLVKQARFARVCERVVCMCACAYVCTFSLVCVCAYA